MTIWTPDLTPFAGPLYLKLVKAIEQGIVNGELPPQTRLPTHRSLADRLGVVASAGGGKHGVKTMFKHITKPAVVSLGTCSSVATIPTNLEEAEDTGVSKDVAEMVVPLGATMHMDGSCFSCVLKIAFVLGVFGEQLSWSRLPFIVLVAVLSSVGMSGVPGGGYIGEYIICTLFFPAQMAIAYPIAVTIGNLVDPPATMINSAGDYVVSFLVARFTEGKDWLERAQREKAAH